VSSFLKLFPHCLELFDFAHQEFEKTYFMLFFSAFKNREKKFEKKISHKILLKSLSILRKLGLCNSKVYKN